MISLAKVSDRPIMRIRKTIRTGRRFVKKAGRPSSRSIAIAITINYNNVAPFVRSAKSVFL